jgi:hypothetical protein
MDDIKSASARVNTPAKRLIQMNHSKGDTPKSNALSKSPSPVKVTPLSAMLIPTISSQTKPPVEKKS